MKLYLLWETPFLLNVLLDILNGISNLGLKGDSFAIEYLYEKGMLLCMPVILKQEDIPFFITLLFVLLWNFTWKYCLHNLPFKEIIKYMYVHIYWTPDLPILKILCYLNHIDFSKKHPGKFTRIGNSDYDYAQRLLMVKYTLRQQPRIKPFPMRRGGHSKCFSWQILISRISNVGSGGGSISLLFIWMK